jgi:hypothetical protein
MKITFIKDYKIEELLQEEDKKLFIMKYLDGKRKMNHYKQTKR